MTGKPLDAEAASAATAQRDRLRRVAWLVAALTVVFLIVWRWPIADPLKGAAAYTPLHTILETASIVVEMLVFGIVWNAYRRERSGNVMILACVLLAAGIIDVVHTLSFAGMPDFITPSGTAKAADLWLAARFLVAVGFLVVALRPWTPLSNPRTRWLLLGGSLAIAAVVVWGVTFHQGDLPVMFIVNKGLTATKIAIEYVIVAILVVPTLIFFRRSHGAAAYDAPSLFAATSISILSELAFTLFTDASDIFNLLGHVYKVIAYLFIYRALFVSSVREPFERLRQVEAALREREERSRQIIDNVPDGVFLLEATPDGRFRSLELNPAFEVLSQLGAAELTGAIAGGAVPEETAALVNAKYRRAVEANGPSEEEVELDLPVGRRTFHSTLVPATDVSGRVNRLVGITRDVTERSRAAEALRRLNRELRALSTCNEVLMRATDEPTLLADICRIVCDAAGYRMAWVGYAEQDAAKSVRPVAWAGAEDGYLQTVNITWADRANGRGPAGAAIRKGRTVYVQDFATDPRAAPWRDAAASRGYRATIGLPLRDDRGTVFGVLTIYAAEPDAFTPEEVRLLEELAGDLAFGIGVLRARESQTALEAQLRQAQKMEVVGQLAGGIAHDFNNLLTAIGGYGELLRAELPSGDARSHQDLAEMLDAADRAALLTRQLLAFSRRQVLVPAVLAPSDVVGRIAPMLCRLLGEQVELTVSAEPEAGRVRVDPGQLEQVIVNLAVNARDAMPGGGRLTIGTAAVEVGPADAVALPSLQPGSYVALTVTDTGTGMDAETRSHLFEPFFTTKPEGQGTGLGLATVHGIVHQSGGSVAVHSEPGEGTTVRVYLPRVTESAAAAGPAVGPSVPVPGGTESVLLVEDNPAVRAYTERVLSDLGYAVLEAASGADALSLAAATPGRIDLLVTDIVMPGMQGVELTRRLCGVRPDTRVLYMSGFDRGALGQPELRADVSFLAKPFTGDALGLAVRSVLDATKDPIAEASPLAPTT